jgi:hypothetical protein
MPALSHRSKNFFCVLRFWHDTRAGVKCAERAESIPSAGPNPGHTKISQGAEVPIIEYVEPEPRLSQMTTHWTAVIEAHSGTPDQVNPAVSRLMCRYAGAVHRYFLKAVKNPDDAEELDQECAMK